MGRLNLADIDQRHHPDQSRTAGVDVLRTYRTVALDASIGRTFAVPG
jgi:hypothetical protein